MAIATFPKFSGIGRTSSLLDEELILLGNDDLGTKGGRYVPRSELLDLEPWSSCSQAPALVNDVVRWVSAKLVTGTCIVSPILGSSGNKSRK